MSQAKSAFWIFLIVTLAYPAAGQEAPTITSAAIDAEHAARKANPELIWLAGCGAQVAQDCTRYAAFLVKRSKTPTPEDAKAVGFLERGCKLGDAIGCRLLAVFRRNGRGGPADLSKARAATERACALGDKGACAP